MSSRLLLAVFDIVYLFALASWVGSILFFSFGVAPVIFRVLGAEAGGRFVRVLFPRYYAWGVVSSGIALPAFLGAPLSFPEYKGWWVGVQAFLILGSTLTFLYCANSLTPAVNAARDAGAEGADRFNRLHRRSVRINSLLLLVGIVLLATQATRRPPQTAGIVEMNPQERLQYDVEFRDALEEIVTKRPPRPNAEPTGTSRFKFDGAARKELEELVAAKREREANKRRDRGESPPEPSPTSMPRP